MVPIKDPLQLIGYNSPALCYVSSASLNNFQLLKISKTGEGYRCVHCYKILTGGEGVLFSSFSLFYLFSLFSLFIFCLDIHVSSSLIPTLYNRI